MYNIELDECGIKRLRDGYVLQVRIDGLLVDIKRADFDPDDLGYADISLLMRPPTKVGRGYKTDRRR